MELELEEVKEQQGLSSHECSSALLLWPDRVVFSNSPASCHPEKLRSSKLLLGAGGSLEDGGHLAAFNSTNRLT